LKICVKSAFIRGESFAFSCSGIKTVLFHRFRVIIVLASSMPCLTRDL